MAFLTTTPNSVVKPIHPNRMPVILHREDYDTWLTRSPREAFELARPYPADEMLIVAKGEKKDEPPLVARRLGTPMIRNAAI